MIAEGKSFNIPDTSRKDFELESRCSNSALYSGFLHGRSPCCCHSAGRDDSGDSAWRETACRTGTVELQGTEPRPGTAEGSGTLWQARPHLCAESGGEGSRCEQYALFLCSTPHHNRADSDSVRNAGEYADWIHGHCQAAKGVDPACECSCPGLCSVGTPDAE